MRFWATTSQILSTPMIAVYITCMVGCSTPTQLTKQELIETRQQPYKINSLTRVDGTELKFGNRGAVYDSTEKVIKGNGGNRFGRTTYKSDTLIVVGIDQVALVQTRVADKTGSILTGVGVGLLLLGAFIGLKAKEDLR